MLGIKRRVYVIVIASINWFWNCNEMHFDEQKLNESVHCY